MPRAPEPRLGASANPAHAAAVLPAGWPAKGAGVFALLAVAGRDICAIAGEWLRRTTGLLTLGPSFPGLTIGKGYWAYLHINDVLAAFTCQDTVPGLFEDEG